MLGNRLELIIANKVISAHVGYLELTTSSEDGLRFIIHLLLIRPKI